MNSCWLISTVIMICVEYADSSSMQWSSETAKKVTKYNISPKLCKGRLGEKGVCMFNFECQRNGGTVLGTCIDGFLFGACCSTQRIDAFESSLSSITPKPRPVIKVSSPRPNTTQRPSTTFKPISGIVGHVETFSLLIDKEQIDNNNTLSTVVLNDSSFLNGVTKPHPVSQGSELTTSTHVHSTTGTPPHIHEDVHLNVSHSAQSPTTSEPPSPSQPLSTWSYVGFSTSTPSSTSLLDPSTPMSNSSSPVTWILNMLPPDTGVDLTHYKLNVSDGGLSHHSSGDGVLILHTHHHPVPDSSMSTGADTGKPSQSPAITNIKPLGTYPYNPPSSATSMQSEIISNIPVSLATLETFQEISTAMSLSSRPSITSSSTMPPSTIPLSTKSSSTMSPSTIPLSTLPSSTMSPSTIPLSTLPSSTMSPSTIPLSTLPSSTMPSFIGPSGLVTWSGSKDPSYLNEGSQIPISEQTHNSIVTWLVSPTTPQSQPVTPNHIPNNNPLFQTVSSDVDIPLFVETVLNNNVSTPTSSSSGSVNVNLQGGGVPGDKLSPSVMTFQSSTNNDLPPPNTLGSNQIPSKITEASEQDVLPPLYVPPLFEPVFPPLPVLTIDSNEALVTTSPHDTVTKLSHLDLFLPNEDNYLPILPSSDHIPPGNQNLLGNSGEIDSYITNFTLQTLNMTTNDIDISGYPSIVSSFTNKPVYLPPLTNSIASVFPNKQPLGNINHIPTDDPIKPLFAQATNPFLVPGHGTRPSTSEWTEPSTPVTVTTLKSTTTTSTTTTTTPSTTTTTPSTTTTTPSTTTVTTTSTTTTTTTAAPNWDYKTDCGVRPIARDSKIVGGKRAQFGDWPWQALVRESTWLGLFSKNKCGGVLLNRKFVITAGHCQPSFLASLVVVLGEYDISGDFEPMKTVTKNVKKVIVHRDYNPATFENDLAILELEDPVDFRPHIVPICMPDDSSKFEGSSAIVTGWGRLKYGGGVPTVLQQVKVPMMENGKCQKMFEQGSHPKNILPSFLCAGYDDGEFDSCEGDSGGPLMVKGNDGRWVLAGTVSHGIKCAYPNLPGVYMRMTYYKPWIRRIIGNFAGETHYEKYS